MSTTGALANDGTSVSTSYGGDGGSSLTVAGTLTNTGMSASATAALLVIDKVTANPLANSGRSI